MREIKFRMWSRLTATMYWWDLCWGCPSCLGGGWLWGRPDNSSNMMQLDPSEVRVMQYTGLKDENGVEIYEGDIVRYHSTDFNGEVKYSTFKCSYSLFGIPDDERIKELHGVKDIEVIGNIYENPELLGEK